MYDYDICWKPDIYKKMDIYSRKYFDKLYYYTISRYWCNNVPTPTIKHNVILYFTKYNFYESFIAMFTENNRSFGSSRKRYSRVG